MTGASTTSNSFLRIRSILLVSASIASFLLFPPTFGVPCSTSVYFSRISIPSVPESYGTVSPPECIGYGTLGFYWTFRAATTESCASFYDAQTMLTSDSGPVYSMLTVISAAIIHAVAFLLTLSAIGAFYILRLDESDRISKKLISFVGFTAFITMVACAVDLAVFIHGQECLGGTPFVLRGGSANWLTLSAGLIMVLGVLLAIRAHRRSSWTMMEDPKMPHHCVNNSRQTSDEEKAYPEVLQDISTPSGMADQDDGSDFELQSNQSARRSSTPSLPLTPQSRGPSHFAPSNYETAASSSRDSMISVDRDSILAPSVPMRARISTPSFLGHYSRRAGSPKVPTVSTEVSRVSRQKSFNDAPSS
ncbi:unnamed protein product [Cyclocybe aegerita]|uniref:Pali-domain-containing protein n=1 Tax=Cyclocybe aegerita TaxID=1973307 RepID=A0A8S0WSJ6_CYCAE|nr:unnamed protein product [Cyclocybe aegerita]